MVDMKTGAWSSGTAAGLTHVMPTVKKPIDHLGVEAEAIMDQRSARLSTAGCTAGSTPTGCCTSRGTSRREG
jgi:hypothetical protein